MSIEPMPMQMKSVTYLNKNRIFYEIVFGFMDFNLNCKFVYLFTHLWTKIQQTTVLRRFTALLTSAVIL